MQKGFRTIVGALLCALFVFSQHTPLASGEPCTPKIDPTGIIREYQSVQSCFNQGGLVRLEGRTHLLERTVRLGSNTVVEGPSKDRKAEFLAAPNLGNNVIIFGKGSRIEVRNLVINGNKLKRDYDILILGWENNQWVYHRLCDADGWRPANSKFHGTDMKLDDLESINAACGSAMGLHGTRIVVVNFRGEGNGFSAPPRKNGVELSRVWPDRSHQYSDVITSEFCDSCLLENPLIIDPTDLGVVLFGGPNNRIVNLTCIGKSALGFACLNIGRSDTGMTDAEGRKWDGRHDGLKVDGVTVSAAYNTIGAAVVAGTHVYAKDARFLNIVHNAGEMRNVKIDGSQLGVVVDGVEDFILHNPPTGRVQGDLENFNHCRATELAIAGHVKTGVRLPAGFRRMTIDGGDCNFQ